MQNLWQQAEFNSGSIDEALRLARTLRDHITSGGLTPTDVAKPEPPARVGLLGVLDRQAGDISVIKSILADLLVFVGESGQAPLSAAEDMYAKTARR